MTTLELAQRIIDVDFYGAMDADATPQSIAETIKTNPETIIEFLLGMVEDYQS